MALSFAPLESQRIQVLGDYLSGIFAGVNVVQGQQNFTPLPMGSYLSMTTANESDLSTNIATWVAATQSETITRSIQWNVNIEIFGPDAEANAATLMTYFRTEESCDDMTSRALALGFTMSPLYAERTRQTTIVNNENLYEKRQYIQLAMAYQAVITTVLPSAVALDVVAKSVESVSP